MRRIHILFIVLIGLFGGFAFTTEANAQGEVCRRTAEDNRTLCLAAYAQAHQACLDLNDQTDEQCDAARDFFRDDCENDYQAAIALCPAASTQPTTPAQPAPPSIGEQFQSIQEQGIIFANICESRIADCECRDVGNCSLNDILQVAVNVMIFILGISGTAVLLMFVYGGFLWLTSAGRPDAITNGKNTMIGAVVGLIIIFGSYAAITLLIGVLRTGSIPTGDLEEVVGGDSGSVIDTAR